MSSTPPRLRSLLWLGLPLATVLLLQIPGVRSGAARGTSKALAGGSLVLVGGGTVGALALRRRQQKQLKAHLETLQSRVANLLMGCDQLLTGSEPDSMVPYQLFVESDGERYPELDQKVRDWLIESRQALDQAFQVHAHLQEDAAQLKQPLHKQVEAWEMLYLSFVGKSEHIRTLSDKKLQRLLNPAVVLRNSNTGFSQGLTAQLKKNQGNIEGTPLKVNLKRAVLQDVDALGILGRMDQVDAAVYRLQRAVTDAPQKLATVRNRRQALERHFPASLRISPEVAYRDIDARIAVATTALDDELYLTVVESCKAIGVLLDVMASLNQTFRHYDSQQAQIQSVISAGYQSPKLQAHQAATQAILEQIEQFLEGGDACTVLSDLLDQLAYEIRTLDADEALAATLKRLKRAIIEAPKQVAAIRTRRRVLARDLPASLRLEPEAAFQNLDRLIAAVATTLDRDRRYLKVLEDCQDIDQSLDLIATLGEAFRHYDAQQNEIQALTATGYRPPELPAHQAATQEALEHLQQQLRAGVYQAIPHLLSRLEDAHQKARQTALTWQAHHRRNQAILQSLTDESSQLLSVMLSDVAATWNSLQAYPSSNWIDLEPQLNTAKAHLKEVCEQELPDLKQQNDFAVQAFAAVSKGCEAIRSCLQEAKSQTQAVIARWELVQSAENSISRELATLDACIQETTRFVTDRLLGLWATKAPDSRLYSAVAAAENAHNYATTHEYLRACQARDRALQIVLKVYLDKARERTSKVQSLVRNSDARGKGFYEFNQAQKLMASNADIDQATGQALFTYYANAESAWDLMKTAERLARRAIRQTRARRRR